MQILLLHKKQVIEEFLQELNQLNAAYINRDYDLDQKVTTYLKTVEEGFEKLGESKQKSVLSNQQTYLETAQRGIKPETLEKQKTGRRSMVSAAIFQSLEVTGNVLREYHEINELKIKETETILSQIILSVIQSGVVDVDAFAKADTPEKLKKIWNTIVSNQQFKLLEYKLKINATDQDILLLTDQLITRML